jgi:hypothetical protein
MKVYEIDPTRDRRWDEFLETHPDASIFHTQGWLRALQLTYGYTPVAITTSAPGNPLLNGLPFCRVNSWITGRRLVSVPFADHCAPLVSDSEQLTSLLLYLQEKADREKWSYVEIRPRESVPGAETEFGHDKEFLFHRLCLSPTLEEIFRNFHRDCVQRKIQRAEREQLIYQEGTSISLLGNFYHLMSITRRRHGLPPQPAAWFRNLVTCLDRRVKIRIAFKHGKPIASILTIRYKNTMVYKYGCSDQRYNNLGGTQLLFWKAICEAKKHNITEFDMGRCDCYDLGLATFKERWGATRTAAAYIRHPSWKASPSRVGKPGRFNLYLWSHIPERLLTAAGELFYKHMA